MRLYYVLFSAVALALSIALFLGSFAYFKTQEIEKATARLTLYRNTLEAEIRHFAHLPFLLSLDPMVTGALAQGDTETLDQRLAQFAQNAGVDAIYLMDQTGLTLSASNAKTDLSFKGQNYAFRPYFQEAQQGLLGEFYGIGATTGKPGYFYATEVRAPRAGQDGVIAIKIDLSTLQDNWHASGERIILTNADGVAVLASNPSWRYKTLHPLSPQQRERIVASRQFAREALQTLEWSVDQASQTARIDGEQLLYLRSADLPNSWSLHFFVPDDQATARAWLTTGAFLVLVMMSFIAFQLSRVRRIGAALQRSETEEALLRQANDKLAVEIEERRIAERSLQKTQAELERAGRLAALGQLASSVTHELGQPIAAMRNQLAAAEITGGATPLTEKMQGLVARMEGITRQLKFFSRKGRDQFESIDLREVMDEALDLLEPSTANCNVRIDLDRPPMPLTFTGNRLRIEQVITNIVRNALDALEDSENRQIDIAMGDDDTHVWFEVCDSGHGLGDKSLDDLREPFATTRESGKGMGLGLTISAGIVSDHGGAITATDRAEGGAMFRVELPKEKEAKPT